MDQVLDNIEGTPSAENVSAAGALSSNVDSLDLNAKQEEAMEGPPGKAPVDTPVDTPVETHVETSPETLVESPAKIPAESPAKIPAETHVETPAETHVETHVETPVETSVENPAEILVETPVETPAESAAKIPAETHGETCVETPVENLPETPEETASDDGFVHIDSSSLQKDTAMKALSSIIKSEQDQASLDGGWVALSSLALKVHALGESTPSTDSSTENSLHANAAAQDRVESRILSYDQLKITSTDLALNVDPTKRESYLSDAEFESLFGMSKAQFYALPKWKQAQRKLNLDLF